MYQPHYAASHAVIVGINAYLHAPKLAYAKADAEAVARILIDTCGFPEAGVHLIIDGSATGAAIRRIYLNLAQAATTPDDRLLFFFAGHGMTLSGRRGEVGYLVPADGDPADVTTLIRWDELTRHADLIAAKHILFIMDACYGGLALARTTRPGTMRFLKDMLLRPARQVLTAGKADEVVSDSGGPRPGHSVFTGHLLNAIDGAVKTAEGIVTASAVMAYVYDRVATDGHSHQTPHYGHVDGDGDFVFLAPVLTSSQPAATVDTDILVAVPAGLRPPHAGSPGQLADEIKELVAEPRSRIRLDDLTTDRLRAALALLEPSRFNFNEPITAETLSARLELYECAVAELAVEVILLARWGTDEHAALLTRVFSRLADLNSPVGGYTVWIGLRWYPLMLLHYYAGIAALANDNWRTLARVFLTTSSDPQRDDEERLVITRANSSLADAHDAFKLLPGHERQYTPRSELLFKRLQPLLEDLCFLGTSYERLFDRFEILNALVHADTRGNASHWWGPPGRYAWKYRNRANGGPLGEVEQEALRAGAAWPPLSIGLFQGSPQRLKEVLDGLKVLMRELRWF